MDSRPPASGSNAPSAYIGQLPPSTAVMAPIRFTGCAWRGLYANSRSGSAQRRGSVSGARNPALTRLQRRRKPRFVPHVSSFVRDRGSAGTRMRDLRGGVSLQVPATIHVDDLPGDEIAPEQEDDGLRDIPRPTMPLKRQTVGMTLEITLICTWRRQNQPRRHRIDRNPGREGERDHPRKLGEYVFAQNVPRMSEVEPLEVRIVQVDDAAPIQPLREIAAERQRHPRIDLHIRREAGPGELGKSLDWEDGRVVDENIELSRHRACTSDERDRK